MDMVNFWERKYRRNLGRIVAICYRYVNDRAMAEDLAQDVFVKAMEKFTTIRALGRFDAWLTRIAVNHCTDYLRRQPDFVPLELESIAETTTEDEWVWTADFTEEELLAAIGQLPEIQRTVFNLHAIERYSHRHIARMLGISADNARQLHHRARERLCQMLTDQYKKKEKRKKGLFMIILFASLKRAHANPRRIDRLYRSRLLGLRMEPLGIDKRPEAPHFAAHVSATSPGKITSAFATHKTAILLVAAAGVAGVTGGAIGFQAGKNAASGTNSGNGPVVETLYATLSDTNELTEPLAGANQYSPLPVPTDNHPVIGRDNHSPQRSHLRDADVSITAAPEPSNTIAVTLPMSDTTPVIVISKIPVHRTIVIRDTTTISETVLLDYD